MRLLAIGGGGAVGRAALLLIRKLPGIEQIFVADINPTAAAAAADQVGEKAQALELDLLDEPAMARALAGADIVINTAGPFFRYAIPTLKAVIAAGRPYLDVCDDPEPTLGMCMLDRPARAQGVTAVVGLGAAPGVTNYLAVAAYQALDRVEVLATGCNCDTAFAGFGAVDDPAAAVHVHRVQQLSGHISLYRRGARELAPALGPVRLALPGYGTRTLYRIGQPEGVTLGRHYPELGEAPGLVSLGAAPRALLQDLAKAMAKGGMDVDQAGETLGRGVGAAGRLRRLAQRLAGKTDLPELFALARGSRAGAPASALATLKALPGASLTAVAAASLAAGLQLLLEGRLAGPGVHAPEAAAAPGAFFAALAGYCAPPAGDDELLRLRID